MNSVVDTITVEEINKIFAAQKANQFAVANSTVKEIKEKLKALKKAIETTFRKEIQDAMMADFKKPLEEVDLSEIFVMTSEIKHALHHLGQWMRDKPVETPMSMLGSK